MTPRFRPGEVDAADQRTLGLDPAAAARRADRLAAEEAARRRGAVWSTLARTVAAYALLGFGLALGGVTLAAILYTLLAYGLAPLARWLVGA